MSGVWLPWAVSALLWEKKARHSAWRERQQGVRECVSVREVQHGGICKACHPAVQPCVCVT